MGQRFNGDTEGRDFIYTTHVTKMQ